MGMQAEVGTSIGMGLKVGSGGKEMWDKRAMYEEKHP